MDKNKGIGILGRLPWRLSTDLKRFKRLSLGHPVIMGRKTYESIGKPLTERVNIVISRNIEFSAPGCIVAPSIDAALRKAEEIETDEVFIIGGGEIFRQAYPMTDRIYLTLVDTTSPETDVFFNDLDIKEWAVTYREDIPAGEKDDFPTTFLILDRAS